MNVDFGKTASDYARFRAGYPDRFFELLASAGVGLPGQRVLDLGTGTGALARGLAKRGVRVTAIDLSQALLDQAAALDRTAGVEVNYLCGVAESVAVPSASFDVVTASQCWHWFDRPRVVAEARRLLVDGGKLAITYLDWIAPPGSAAHATEELILQHNPAWDDLRRVGSEIYPEWLGDLSAGGFAPKQPISLDVEIPYSHEAWRGRVRASAGIGATLSYDGVTRFDAALAALLADRFPSDPLTIPHRTFALVADCAHPPDATKKL